jgi:hypothetical protein
MFEMTNANECLGDALFVCGLQSDVFDEPFRVNSAFNAPSSSR